ncbi:MAG: glucose-1-phosphate adenylyltransferase [Candidatus Krumholzibacteria bacterium]|nr:glucose-1-phosphate adenylyltransferase [Candidatus Krumholzibacteria bacterium]
MKILTMILAGGTGEGLSVLTRHRARTAVPFGGRYRVIDFCLSNAVHSGLTDINILAQYNPKSLIEHIRMGKPWDLDRKHGGVTILQPSYHGEAAHWYLGTADALYQNLDIIKDSGCDLVLVLSGDQVYVADYGEIIAFHLSHDGPVTIACKKVSPRESSRFGMIRCARDGLVKQFREKPARSLLSDRASLGIYLFNARLLAGLLRANGPDIVFDMLIPLIEEKKVFAFPFDSYWEDIGSIAAYYRASMRLLRGGPLTSKRGWPVYTRGDDMPPARFCEESEVSDSIVACGCRIEGKVSGSILFPGASVEKDAEVRDSIVFSNSRIRRGARVERTILDKDVTVGTGACIGFAEQPSGDITVIGKGASVRNDAAVRRGRIVEPGEKVRDQR